MKLAGGAKLAGEKVDFDFSVASLAGAPLGRGEGRHDVRSGAGRATFETGDLGFVPSGLQPSAFSPYFVGLVSDAVGAMSGRFGFSWTKRGVASEGAIDLAGVSFQGPTLAISRTSGVEGRIVLSSLAPLATPGVQTISVGKMDMDALQLNGGRIEFAFPGDDTLLIERAEFNWYGGVVGAYDAVAPLGAGRVGLELRAANVDLGVLLDSLNVGGLTGQGKIEGVLPIVFEDGRARVENGELRSVGSGVLKYDGPLDQVAATNEGARIAFEALENLQFRILSARINGPLDGVIDLDVRFEGTGSLTVDDRRVDRPVTVPFIYRMNIKAPALDLIREGRAAVDFTAREGGLGETIRRLGKDEPE